MSSASKLRSSILKKRAAMSHLNPNVKRRVEGEDRQIKFSGGVGEETPLKERVVAQRAAACIAHQKIRQTDVSPNGQDSEDTDPTRMEARREGWRLYYATNRDHVNEQARQRYKIATAAIDALKRDRLGGHCSFPGCDVPWSRCDVDHMRPELKRHLIAACSTVGMLQGEIERNTTIEDGVEQLHLRLLCPNHHRARTAIQRGHRHAGLDA
jgi:hypothetical protein